MGDSEPAGHRTAPTLVVTAVLRDGDRLLLCHRSPDRRWYPNVWDLPGGHVEPGEQPANALVRELAEEIGIQVLAPTGPPLVSLGLDDEVDQWIWLLDRWDGPVRNTAPEEHDALAWVSIDELSTRPLAHPAYLELLTGILR